MFQFPCFLSFVSMYIIHLFYFFASRSFFIHFSHIFPFVTFILLLSSLIPFYPKFLPFPYFAFLLAFSHSQVSYVSPFSLYFLGFFPYISLLFSPTPHFLHFPSIFLIFFCLPIFIYFSLSPISLYIPTLY